jgi:hypothetical protein
MVIKPLPEGKAIVAHRDERAGHARLGRTQTAATGADRVVLAGARTVVFG